MAVLRIGANVSGGVSIMALIHNLLFWYNCGR
jgi:hypothetical protein